MALSDGATLIQSTNQSTDLILYPVDSVFIQSDKNSEKKGGVGRAIAFKHLYKSVG